MEQHKEASHGMAADMDSDAGNLSRSWQKHSPLIVLVALVTYFWWPSLWNAQVIVHTDAAHHGLSLLSFHAQALLGERELLWDSGIYGGHPLFAEGQGGFANPLNILCAILFDPEYGIGVFHWLSMLLSGVGVYCLGLTLGIRPWPALFASLAVAFSGIWIGFQYNLSVSAALTWAPWLLAAVEHWLNRPTLWRASLMALSAALLIYAGYPHIAHGATIYLAIRLATLLFTQESREQIWAQRKHLILFGTWAVILAVGLSAVQLLPLIELIGQSHREKGVDLPFAGLVGVDTYIKGMLFFNPDPAAKVFTMESLTSSLVVLLFGAVIFTKPSVRMIGHVLAAIFLLNLGMEFASPLFRLIYEFNLIPGLRNYRIMHPFFPLAVIGMAVVAAYVLDNIGDLLRLVGASRLTILCAALYGLLWVALLTHYFVGDVTAFNIAEPFIFLALCAGFSLLGKSNYIAIATVALYVSGVVAYKSDVFNFYDTAVLSAPEPIRIMREDPHLSDFKAASDGAAGAYVFFPSNTQGLDKHYQRYLKSLSPFPALIWGVPSIDGVLALTLARRMLIQQAIETEIEGSSSTQPGSRIIDVLGIKYASRHAPTNAAGLELIHHDTDDGVLIYRNNYARPRFQLYERAAFVDSPDAALKQLIQSEPGLLLVEDPSTESNPQGQACAEDPSQPARLEVSQATSMHYQMSISTKCPVWLFVADANYPGWEAKVDGVGARLYSSQVMGKAVRVPAGEHHVQLDYVPRSFYVGLSITLVSLVLVFISLLLALRKRYRS